MNIGAVFLELLADGAKLQPQVEAEAAKAGDAGAKTLGQKLGAGLKTHGVRAFGVAATAAFGLATKGALQLEEVQARIQAETGASADEAERMAATVNRVAGENRMSLDEVAEAAIRVRRDLGATGDEADRLTGAFAEFARVTRQDVGAAVTDFDDILDAWGLTAADATRLQDQLLKSQQEFGGSITENQRALAQMAPALRALNADVDDGIGLLNLFAASGMDASAAQRALNTAVNKLPPGTTLEEIVAQIAAIEDPAERAKKAIEVFGSRAGVQLANAIRPGMTGLGDFTVTAEEAAGAVDKAADALDSTPWGWFQKKVSEAKAAIRGFGQAFGPALTGLAALSSMAGTLFPDLGPALSRKLLRGFKLPVAVLKRIGVKVMSMIGLGMATNAAADAIADGVSDGVSGAMRSGRLGKATGKLGEFLGSKLGKGLSVAFAAVAWVEVLETYNRIKGELEAQNNQISTDVANQIATGTTASLEQSKAALEQGLRDINGVWDAGIFTTDTRKRLETDLAGVTAELERRAAGMGPAVASGIESGAPAVDGAVDGMMDGAEARVRGGSWEAAGEEIPKDIAAGILAEQSQVTDALSSLRNQMKNELTPAQEIARNIGILTSEELAKGLRDKRPGVRAEAQKVQAEAEQRLAELIKGGGKVGKKASAELAAGLRSKNPQVRASAQRVKEIVSGELDKTKTSAGNAGQRAGEAFIRRLRKAVASGDFHVNASVGFTLPGKAAGGPVAANQPYLVGEKGPEIFVPEASGTILTHAQTVASARPGSAAAPGATYNIPLTVQGALPVRTTRDIVTELRRLGELGQLPAPTLAPKYHRREVSG